MMNTLPVFGEDMRCAAHTHTALSLCASVLVLPSSRVLCLAVRATGRHNAESRTHTRGDGDGMGDR